jgi:hypothetical protein
MKAETSSQLDAINYRLLGLLPPESRLRYYVLSYSEQALLNAICTLAPPAGQACAEPIEMLAKIAGISRRTVQNLLNGHVRAAKRTPGLKDRGIISELAPANRGQRKPAVIRINWPALEVNSPMAEYLGEADGGELGEALMKVQAAEA